MFGFSSRAHSSAVQLPLEPEFDAEPRFFRAPSPNSHDATPGRVSQARHREGAETGKARFGRRFEIADEKLVYPRRRPVQAGDRRFSLAIRSSWSISFGVPLPSAFLRGRPGSVPSSTSPKC